jgi:hypothetical protein
VIKASVAVATYFTGVKGGGRLVPNIRREFIDQFVRYI